ncbi:hypothetical protein J6S37_02085 [Candidatus Saccharibacteria bacterium]|nr:hypothetical protein [Candidatus Saccharibacteria bacterium]
MHESKTFARMVHVAYFITYYGGQVEKAITIKENIRYMRIKRLKREASRKKSTIAPAAWQEFIEI